MRERFTGEPAFDAVALESERVRLYKEFMLAMEEACGHKHHHQKKRKTKKTKRKSRSRSASPAVSLHTSVWSVLGMGGTGCAVTETDQWLEKGIKTEEEIVTAVSNLSSC